MRRRKTLLLLVAISLLGVGSTLAYLAWGDLSWVGSWLTRVATNAMARPLVVEGRFEPDFLATAPRLIATDVVLGDPDGELSPGMVRVDFLEGSVSFSSLYSLPVRIERLHVQGGLVRLGPAGDGRPNWHFGEGDKAEAKASSEDRPPVTFGSALLESVTLRYEPLDGAPPLVLEIDRLEIDRLEVEPVDLDHHGDGLHKLTVAGRFQDRPFQTSGTTTRLADLIFLDRPVNLDLEAGLAEAVATVVGSVGRLWVLGEPDLRLSLEGPEIAQLTEAFGLPSLGSGRFAAEARTSTASQGIQVEIEADLGDLRAKAEGDVDDLLKPRQADLRVEASGPDLAAAGALAGVRTLPQSPFDVAGGLSIDNGLVSFHELTANAADCRLEVSGALGLSPGFIGTDLEFTASGPDLRPFEALAGLSLPAGRFATRGRLVSKESTLEFDQMDLRVGGATAGVRGTLGAPPHRLGTDLHLDISVESLGAIGGFMPRSLLDESLEASVRIASAGERLRLEAEAVRLGDDEIDVLGTFSPEDPLHGARLEIRASGPDLGATAELLDLEGLPARPFELDGGFEIGSHGYTLLPTTLRSAGDQASAEGVVGSLPGLVGTDLEISGSGEDASRILSNLHGFELPPAPWELDGRLRRGSGTLELDGVEATLGEVTGRISGSIALGSTDSPTRLDVAVRGQSLAAIETWSDLPPLPDEPFSVTGRVGIESDHLRLETVEVTLSENRLQLDGEIPTDPAKPGGDLTLDGGGLELSGLMRAAVGAKLAGDDLLAVADAVAGHPWKLNGRILGQTESYDLTPFHLQLGDGLIEVEGTLARASGLVGTDLTLNAHGEDAAPLAALAGLSVPAEPFSIETRLRREERTTSVSGLELEIGGNKLSLDGTLGDSPRFADTSLTVAASGPRVNLLKDLAGASLPVVPEWLPEALLDLPFDISGRIRGSLDSFDLEALKATVGKSDVDGSLSMNLRHPFGLQGHLTSNRIHMAELRGPIQEATEEPVSQAATSPEKPKQARLIPDTPLSLSWLPDATGDFRLDVAELISRTAQLREVTIGVRMDGGHLTLDPLTAKGPAGGRVTGQLLIQAAGDGLSLTTTLSAQNIRLAPLAPDEDPSRAIPLDLDLSLASSGSSLRTLAESATGKLRSTLGAGHIDRRFIPEIFPKFLATALDAIDPLHQEDDIALFECGFVYLTLGDGLAKLAPLVLQSDRAAILGGGEVRFSDENLDFHWVVKPRGGLGTSSVASAANPYLKLGGTLAHPQVEIKPIEATVSASVAAATGGVSILARALWRRVTSGKDICKKASRKAERKWAENP